MSVRVVVIGGGYAGVMAANRLAGDRGSTPVQVVLVTAAAAFVERIRLHEYASGASPSATVPFASLLHPAVHLRVGAVDRIDPADRVLALADGDELTYDHLICAAGSRGRGPQGVGVHTIADVDAAARLRDALAALRPGAVVAVVGGGLTGLEASTEIAEQHPSFTVRLHSGGEIAPGVAPTSRARLRRRLARRGVEVVEGTPVAVDGDVRAVLGADVVVWCAGFRAPTLAADSGLPVDADGRLRVDATLAVVGGDGRVFGAGDAAVIDDPRYGHHRMGCASALPMGAHAAEAVLRSIAGTAPEALSAGFVAQCISLGRRDALVQGVTAADRPRRLALLGRPAALVKEAVCRQTLRWLRTEARRPGSYAWPSGPTTQEASWR